MVKILLPSHPALLFLTTILGVFQQAAADCETLKQSNIETIPL